MIRRLVDVRAADLLTMALALSAGGALAAAVVGESESAGKGRSVVPTPPPAVAVQPSLDLIPARLEAVNLAERTVTLRGQRVPWHAERLKVLGAGGQQLSTSALRAGQAVRLALEPELPAAAQGNAKAAAGAKMAAPARRIVLIYIDG